MSTINIKPFESNIGGNFFRSDSQRVNKNRNSATSNSNTQFKKVAGTLSIQRNSNEQVKISSDVKIVTAKERIERRASNQLLSASLSLTTRASLNDELIAGVNKLKIIVSNIEKEANPLNKQKLVDEATSLATSLTDQFEKAANEDPTLTKEYNTTILLSPNANIDTAEKFTQISIPSLTSPNESGLAGIDFSNSAEASEKLELSFSNLRNKQSQLENVATDISQSTSLALSNLKSENNTTKNTKEDENDIEIVKEVTENFLKINSIDQSTNKNIVEILDKSISEAKDSKESSAGNRHEDKKSNEKTANTEIKPSIIDLSA